MDILTRKEELAEILTDDEDDVRSFCTVSSSEDFVRPSVSRYCTKQTPSNNGNCKIEQFAHRKDLSKSENTSLDQHGFYATASTSNAANDFFYVVRSEATSTSSEGSDRIFSSRSPSASPCSDNEVEGSSVPGWKASITGQTRMTLMKKNRRIVEKDVADEAHAVDDDSMEENTGNPDAVIKLGLERQVICSANSILNKKPTSTLNKKESFKKKPRKSVIATSSFSPSEKIDTAVKPAASPPYSLRSGSKGWSLSDGSSVRSNSSTKENFGSVLKADKPIEKMQLSMKRIATNDHQSDVSDDPDSDDETETNADGTEQAPQSTAGKRPVQRRKFGAQYILERDISDGTELFPVRVWNDVNDRRPPKFSYVKNVIIEVPGYQRTPCVCQCITYCDSKCHCMGEPFSRSVTEIAYDEKTRLLRKPSCWQESVIPNVPRSIWECSRKCACGLLCPNRSAQLGCRYPFEIFMTAEKGWGVRPLCDLPAGTFVAEYAGKLKPECESEYWSSATWYTFCLSSDNGPTGYFLDASKCGNFTRFINHGCTPNVVAVNVFYDDSNQDCGMHVGIYTVRKIRAFQELTMDYAKDFWLAKMKAGEYCKCSSRKCLYGQPRMLPAKTG